MGFALDTGSMAVGVPDPRRAKLRTTAEYVPGNHGAVWVRAVCRLVGQVLPLQFR